ncbi:NAD(P)-dependent oxidoreductase [Actinomadura kijaniata]|uniref:NAD(P)-dependent oxidoreductase n=1 Tax=Actinomadura kijaniata TaxID=46161 RepID=UPI000835D5EA|nr:NAD(P)-binding domain-containing protein [Actinomadura kijaniata]
MTRTPVTVLGLGLMGTALAGAFVRAGHPTTVWNRSASRPTPPGATRAAGIGEAVAASPLTVVCLSVYDNAASVLDEARDVLPGRTVVNLTNGAPAQARALSGEVAGYGAAYLDGGIMAVPPMVGRPEALVLYSGPAEAFRTHEGTLGALGTARHLGEDPGMAALYDLALLSAMFGMYAGFYQAVALVRSEKVAAGAFAPMVTELLAAMLPSLRQQAEQIDAGAYATTVSSIDTTRAGLPGLFAAGRDQGVDTRLMEPFRELVERAVAAGHGSDGLARLVELL